jgi:hypothetical protein
MLPSIANEDSTRFSFWPHVRRFAVPPAMIETATARRRTGDWAGACAAAHVDVDLDLRSLARTHGGELAARIRADLRHLAPDLLRWHLPRVAPDGLLRPGLTVPLARYAAGRDGGEPVHLVVRTPPAWAGAGQRISLTLWDGSRTGAGTRRHPHPRPSRRFRLDLHRHLWDARRAGELRGRSGADRWPYDGSAAGPLPLEAHQPCQFARELEGRLPPGLPCAVDRWAAEAALVLHAEGRSGGPVTVRFGARRRLDLEWAADGTGAPSLRIAGERPAGGGPSATPVLPDAATWVPPDLELLRAGLIGPDALHPLVASALAPRRSAPPPPRDEGRSGGPQLVECRGALHRIGLVDGALVPLDHDPAEIRGEELLAALGGTPLPCLRVIDAAHRHPEALPDIRARLDHGDTVGALAAVEALLGPNAQLRNGTLRDALESAAQRRVTHGLFQAGLTGYGSRHEDPGGRNRGRPRDHRSHPREATTR